MFERFSEKAIKSIVLAQQEARRYCHNSVGTEHILLGVLGEGSGIAAQVLRPRVQISDVREKVEALMGRGLSAPSIELPFTPRARAALQMADAERERLGHTALDTGHILWALLPADPLDINAGSVAARALEDLGLDCAQLREKALELLQNPEVVDEQPKEIQDAQTLAIPPVLTDTRFACPHCCELIRIGASVCRYCRRSPSDHYRRCHACAEWIQDKATICRFCKTPESQPPGT